MLPDDRERTEFLFVVVLYKWKASFDPPRDLAMGVASKFIKESFPLKSKFSPTDIPDLTGKTIIVTGASGGIGKEIAKGLLSHNAKVYMAQEIPREAADVIIQELYEETGNRAILLKLDLSNLKAVKEAAEEFLSKETQLHVLYNNGGILAPPIDTLTPDGYDLTFGINALGHFYFTTLLLPTLIATAKTSPDGKTRIVNTASSAHLFIKLDFDAFRDGPARRKLSPNALYANSKYAIIVFATELARRYGDQGIVCTSLNPGHIKTPIQRNLKSFEKRFLNLIAFKPPFGALTPLWAGTSPEGTKLNGKYLVPWAKIGKPRKDSQDPTTGKRLWAWVDTQIANV
jgi:NAD(P)-dependent dehydrogenase (short-subunit alcohol dehydrogenase family)